MLGLEESPDSPQSEGGWQRGNQYRGFARLRVVLFAWEVQCMGGAGPRRSQEGMMVGPEQCPDSPKAAGRAWRGAKGEHIAVFLKLIIFCLLLVFNNTCLVHIQLSEPLYLYLNMSNKLSVSFSLYTLVRQL